MPHHTLTCHAMPHHAMPHCAMPCHAIPSHAMPCHAMPCPTRWFTRTCMHVCMHVCVCVRVCVCMCMCMCAWEQAKRALPQTIPFAHAPFAKQPSWTTNRGTWPRWLWPPETQRQAGGLRKQAPRNCRVSPSPGATVQPPQKLAVRVTGHFVLNHM